MPAAIDDTYAEAFRSIYASVLITARDHYWLDKAVSACTGNASSTILCDCEAGLDHHVSQYDSIDGRPGAVVQFHVPRFHKDREQRLERSVLVRPDVPDNGRVQRAGRERKLVRQHATAETRR